KPVTQIDEVIIYPCNPTEMSLRLQLASRKRREVPVEDIITIDGLVINPISYEVIVDGSPVSLTYKEFELLKFLANHTGRVYARQTLVKKIWKHDYDSGMRTVDVHIRRLRAKLGKYSHLITTVRNVGYRFSEPAPSMRTGRSL
ncbi:MAG TPA: response regulator transcription factor, partial [Anaerolineae bacterium]|nr:response regulator transcription factor [Anaerolineae bacterium]